NATTKFRTFKNPHATRFAAATSRSRVPVADSGRGHPDFRTHVVLRGAIRPGYDLSRVLASQLQHGAARGTVVPALAPRSQRWRRKSGVLLLWPLAVLSRGIVRQIAVSRLRVV